MEDTVRWYKRHLAGFVQNFEDDIKNELYGELEAAFEYVCGMIEDYTHINLDNYSMSSKDLLDRYLKERARSIDDDAWFNEDHKLLRNIIKWERKAG